MIPAPESRLHLPGLDLPAAYRDAQAEYQLLATSAGYIDCRHLGFVLCQGPDAMNFLQGLLSQDMRALAVGAATDAWMLNAGGKILHAVRVNRLEGASFLLETQPGEAEAVLTHLDRYLIMEDAALSLASDRLCLSVQGKTAAAPANFEGHAIAHDRCGFGGVDLLLDNSAVTTVLAALKDAGVEPVGFTALNRARVEAFIPWFGPDMQAGNNPLIYGNGNRISKTKGCFIGQETVAKTRDRGRPPRLLLQLETTGNTLPSDAQLHHEGSPVGAISSVTPAGDKLCALAMTKYAVAVEAETLLDANGRTWTITRRAAYK